MEDSSLFAFVKDGGLTVGTKRLEYEDISEIVRDVSYHTYGRIAVAAFAGLLAVWYGLTVHWASIFFGLFLVYWGVVRPLKRGRVQYYFLIFKTRDGRSAAYRSASASDVESVAAQVLQRCPHLASY